MDQGIESVYNLIPHEYVKPKQPPRYQSKFRPSVRIETKQGKQLKQSLGVAKLKEVVPDKWLKKGSGNPPLPIPKKFHYPDEGNRRPDVPKAHERPLHGIHTQKNYVNTNAIENIMSVAKHPVPRYADDKHGATHKLEPSGFVPKYRNRDDYGEVPEYIKMRNAEVRQAQKEYDEYVRARMKQGAMKQLTEQERKDMVLGLKKNWEELNFQFLTLSLVTDTISKRYRKERLDMELKQLERDIDLVERHKIIYVSHY